MQLEDAIELIGRRLQIGIKKQVWADLGCGTGTFTEALAGLLPEKSLVYAVDKNIAALNKIPDKYRDVTIEKLYGDFTEIKLPENLDGILMANSLHYVSDKHAFIMKNQTHLIKQKLFLIVEYDTDIPNQWIPYPVSFNSLKLLIENLGYTIEKLRERLSIYRKEKIYSVVIRK